MGDMQLGARVGLYISVRPRLLGLYERCRAVDDGL